MHDSPFFKQSHADRTRLARSAMRRYRRFTIESARDAARLMRARFLLGERADEGAPRDPIVLPGNDSGVWLGHATALLRLAGLTVLTDPVFSARIGVPLGAGGALGPGRLTPCAACPRSIPPCN